MTKHSRSSLQPAHKGYLYQDLATAYILAESLIQRFKSVTVDRKVVQDDQFDDLEIVITAGRFRRQIKSSQDPNRRLTLADFTNEQSSLRFDRLVLSYVRAETAPADEYRLCATWLPPDEQVLAELLELIDIPETVAGCPSQCFRFRAEHLWPLGVSPIWDILGNSAEFTREHVLRFCNRFVIELALPNASNSLLEPGPLEQVLIRSLANAGIGRYPNVGREPQDVAALAVSLATLARTSGGTLTPKDIETQLGIRTDYGRVAQAFPIDHALYQDQFEIRQIVMHAALLGEHQIITGVPGAGKSWFLTRLAEDLRAAGALVARHYCYLEPGDEHVERRITVDVLFGNLLAELTDAEPSLRDAFHSRYTAGLSELEKVVEKAVALGKQVVLVIDGLDHIARVRAEAKSVSDMETDIIEELASMTIPTGVSLVIGSQPGNHLDPLSDRFGIKITEREMPPWSSDSITALATKLDVINALKRSGVINPHSTIKQLVLRAEGNPLYATCLARGLTNGLLAGTITNPEEWLNDAPVIAGNISTYYNYLFNHASDRAQAVGDILGVIDFGVSESDLRKMIPDVLGDWLPRALSALKPILTTVSSQGGVRIYHESFRRFIVETLAHRGRSVANALEPVIDWLNNRGFYRDARAYRFLLPSLLRADRLDEILSHIEVNYVSKSVAHGHPIEAVQRNLSIALGVAARTLRWPDLVRCVELHRSIYTCYEDNLRDPLNYWETYQDLFGPDALAERLLFDGRPTQIADVGLMLCSLVDDAGGTPPWREYLDLADTESGEEEDQRYDREAERVRKERISICTLHGMIRLKGVDRVAPQVLRFFVRQSSDSSAAFIRGLAARIARTGGPEAAQHINTQIRTTVAPNILALFSLGLADEFVRLGNNERAAAIAQEVLAHVGSPLLAVDCLTLGASPSEAAFYASPPSSLSLGFGQHSPEPEPLRTWIASLRLLASGDETTLRTEWDRVEGEGWYRSWLRYIITLSRVEASRRAHGEMPSIQTAFVELASDVRPYVGKPRPCDLYSIRHVIAETLEWGLSLLNSEKDWEVALQNLQAVLDGTSVMLDRSPSGPITPEMAISVLLPYAKRQEVGVMVRTFAEAEVKYGEEIGTYFWNHAQRAMYLARIFNAIDDASGAQSAWAQAGVYLSAYGDHKDITIYDLIESAPALVHSSQQEALAALASTQSLASAMIRHTDGRSTNRAQNAWFRSFLEVDTSAALTVLARSISVRNAITGWPIATAIGDATEHTTTIADPVLVAALQATLPFEAHDDIEAEKYADQRLAVVNRLLEHDRQLGITALKQLIAQVTGDERRHRDRPAARVQAFAQEKDIKIPKIRPSPVSIDEKKHFPPKQKSFSDVLRYLYEETYFTKETRGIDLVAGIRRAGEMRPGLEDQNWTGFVNAFGYRLINLISEGHEEEAIRLIRFFGREVYVSSSVAVHPLVEIADGLERHGCRRAATVAYALAYTKSRGEGGFLALGDETHAPILECGLKLGRAETLETVATEIAYSLRGNIYSVGVSRHIVERAITWGEPAVAKACWWAAYEVIAHRLPIVSDRSGWFENFDPSEALPQSIEEGLLEVLLSILNDPRLGRKIAALAGLVNATNIRPELPRALRWFLTRDATLTSVLLVFHVLLYVESEPFLLTKELSDILLDYAKGQLWGPRVLAQMLLKRSGVECVDCHREPPEDTSAVLSRDRHEAILSLDKGDRLKRIAKIWPELPGLVTRRFNALFEGSDIQKMRCRTRYRLAYGQEGDSRPPTPLLMWEKELFETALHEVLNGLNPHLWATGSWDRKAETRAIQIMLPETFIHLGLHLSRTMRPSYPDPIEQTQGRGEVPILDLDDQDPEFTGWRRVGYMELHWMRPPQAHYRMPEKVVTVYAGAVAEELGTVHESWPFLAADACSDWWDKESPTAPFPASLPSGPIVRLVLLKDWLGDQFVLIPPIRLRAYLSLTLSRYGTPLVWQDPTGIPAIVLRTWRVRNPEALFTEAVEYEGTDLIMRPDIFDRIMALCGCPIREETVVISKELNSVDEA